MTGGACWGGGGRSADGSRGGDRGGGLAGCGGGRLRASRRLRARTRASARCRARQTLRVVGVGVCAGVTGHAGSSTRPALATALRVGRALGGDSACCRCQSDNGTLHFVDSLKVKCWSKKNRMAGLIGAKRTNGMLKERMCRRSSLLRQILGGGQALLIRPWAKTSRREQAMGSFA